jgi:adenylate cyclase
MAIEIERKFLVEKSKFERLGTPYSIKQGYLATDQDRVIRIRTKNEQAYITIKTSTNGITRKEFEYEIPYSDAIELFALCKGFPVIKTRWVSEFMGKTWEVDVFEEANEGLIVAEIELGSEDEKFSKPDWLAQEVSTDVRYFNFNLSINPYRNWQ